MSLPRTCPRCENPKVRLRKGVDWCCWELVQLRDLMARAPTPTMREVKGIFIGRSAKSIDCVCRRYGLKVPAPDRAGRRRRCGACGALFRPADKSKCCPSCRGEETPALSLKSAA